MGREARCECRWGDGAGEVKALLETHELVLRGAVKRAFPLAQLKGVRVSGDELLFAVGAERIALGLGAKAASSWAKKIATPPPTLAQKLGISAAAKALVIGPVRDASLKDALRGVTTSSPDAARLCVAVVKDEAALEKALASHARIAAKLPIWIAHRKGPSSPFGENAVRRVMRQQGFVDSKVAAVSAELSATRYAKK